MCMRAQMTLTREWRARLAERQTPFAALMACSDSRLPAEIVFGQGLGDLFIVRNAGTVFGQAPLASVEFAVVDLKIRLVVVLAHDRCGAFRTAYDHHVGGIPPETGSIRELVERLREAIEGAGPEGTREERCERAASLNARLVARRVARSPVIEPLVRSGELLVVPARYDLAAGTVEFFEPVAAAEPAAAPAER